MIGEKKNILGAILVAGGMCLADAQTAVNLSGKVTDGNSSAVLAGAKVSLVSDSTIFTMTDAQGAFTLTGNVTVGIQSGRSEMSRMSEMSLKGTQLTLSVAKNNTPVTVDVYTMQSRFVRNLVNRTASAGDYTVETAPAGLTNGLYVVRARVGNRSTAFKMTTLGMASSSEAFRSGSVAARALAKTAPDPIDSLKISKDGYKPKVAALTKYTGILALALNPKLPAGDLKIASERSMPQVAWGKNVNVEVWDGGTKLNGGYSESFFEGATSWMVGSTASQIYSAWGFVTTEEPEDMSSWKDGTMHLAVRGTATSIGVTMGSVDQAGGFSKKINLADHGYVPMTSVTDTKWHEVAIPMTAFEGTDFSKITVYCGLVYPVVGDTVAFDPTAFYLVDDIRWSLKK